MALAPHFRLVIHLRTSGLYQTPQLPDDWVLLAEHLCLLMQQPFHGARDGRIEIERVHKRGECGNYATQ